MERMRIGDTSNVGAGIEAFQCLPWSVTWQVDKFHGDSLDDADMYDQIITHGNLLMIGGASAMFQRLIGTGITAFDNTNAYLGVGDSTTAESETHTDLQAVTNVLRKGMEATYPQHTDSTSDSGAKSIVYRSVFGDAEANFAWEEQGLFNASVDGRMLNRKVQDLGTKTTGTWQLTLTLSFT